MIFCTIFLTACVTKIDNHDLCKINKNDELKNLHSSNLYSLSELKIPSNVFINILDSSDDIDYHIPVADMAITNEIKNMRINICPPKICKDIFLESCLIDDQDIIILN